MPTTNKKHTGGKPKGSRKCAVISCGRHKVKKGNTYRTQLEGVWIAFILCDEHAHLASGEKADNSKKKPTVMEFIEQVEEGAAGLRGMLG